MPPEHLEDISELIKLIGYGKFIILLILFTMLINITYVIRRHFTNRNGKDLKIIQQQIDLLTSIKEILERQYVENISLDQCEAILRPITLLNTSELLYMAKDIIENNNIASNKKEIEIKIRENIEHIWQENRNALGKFRYKTRRLHEFIDDKWLDTINQTITRNIFNCSGDKEKAIKAMHRSIKTHFENVKLLTLETISNY